MSSATLQINVIPKRMLDKKEAAHHLFYRKREIEAFERRMMAAA